MMRGLTLLTILFATLSTSPLAHGQQALDENLASWSWTSWSSNIGVTGILASPVGSTREIVLGGGGGLGAGFSYNSFWGIAHYDKVSRGLKRVWTSPAVTSTYESVNKLTAGHLLRNGNPQILVGMESGTVEVWEQKSRTKLFTILTQAKKMRGLAFADLDGKGAMAILVTNTTTLYAYDLKGKLLWSIPGVSGDIDVGNLDKDSSLELAAASGSVVDLASAKVQWALMSAFGRDVEVADVDGDGMDELVAGSPWYWITCYDVDQQLPKWSIAKKGIDSIHLDDLDKDGTIELLTGDDQHGSVTCYDTKTRKVEWMITNPQPGTTGLVTMDLDGDGTKEVVWGAGHNSSGPDQIFVGDWKRTGVQWSSLDLGGRFSNPVRGDVDGDGKPELVVVCRDSKVGTTTGARILVFDGSTYDLKDVSQAIYNSSSALATPQVLLLDVDADKELEILVNTRKLQVWDYASSGFFKSSWELDPGYNVRFEAFVVADLDGKAGLEVAVCDGSYLYTYDFASRAQLTKSAHLGRRPQELLLADSDHDKRDELIVRSADGKLYIFDAATAVAETVLSPGISRQFKTVSILPLPPSLEILVTTDNQGSLSIHLPTTGSGYSTLGPIPTAISSYDSLNILDGNLFMLWSSNEQMTISAGFTPIWKTASYGRSFGKSWLIDKRSSGPRLLTTSSMGLFGFDF